MLKKVLKHIDIYTVELKLTNSYLKNQLHFEKAISKIFSF